MCVHTLVICHDLKETKKKKTHNRVLFVANRDITVKQYIYGEDHYIQSLIKLTREEGGCADVAVIFKDEIKLYRYGGTMSVKNIIDIAKDYDVIVLHNVSPAKILRAKLKHKLRTIMPVYFLWNSALPTVSNIVGRIGLTLWQFIVDEYIVPSYSIARGLRLQGIFRKICVIPPLYKCVYCNFEENIKKRSMLTKELPAHVKVVYIGSLNLKRLPLVEVVKRFTKDQSRTYEITIYTADNVDEKVYVVKNVRIKIVKKILSAEEKCRVLRESHMFIAPRRGTTMIPSISVMEADYHGNIIIRNYANA